jgi:hypothetical protein
MDFGWEAYCLEDGIKGWDVGSFNLLFNMKNLYVLGNGCHGFSNGISCAGSGRDRTNVQMFATSA